MTGEMEQLKKEKKLLHRKLYISDKHFFFTFKTLKILYFFSDNPLNKTLEIN